MNRLALAICFFLVLGGCFEKSLDQQNLVCKPGFSDPCYTGPAETRQVGTCRGGVTLCLEADGEFITECFGEVLPAVERCDELDNDCDGVVDNNGACAQEALDALQLGANVFPIQSPKFIGPTVLFSGTWGTVHYCEPDLEAGPCLDAFVEEQAEVFGLTDAQEQLEVVDEWGDEGATARTWGQVHQGVEVEGGYISATAVGHEVRSVLASVLAVPANLPVEPGITQDGALAAASMDPSEATAVDLVVFTLRDEHGEIPKLEKQEKRLAWRIDGVEARRYVDAQTEELLWERTTLRADLQVQVNGSSTQPTQPPMSDAWDVLQDFYTYVTVDDVFLLNNHSGLNNNGAGGHYNVWIATNANTNATYCTNTTAGITCAAGTAAGCANGQDIWVCQGAYDDETMVHEAGHNVFLQHFSGDDVQGNSLDEALTMFHTELFECEQAYAAGTPGACTWIHNGRNFTATPASLTISSAAADIYDNGRIVGHAWYLIWESFAEGLSDQAANHKLRELLYRTVRHNLFSFDTLTDIFPAMWKTCMDLKSMNASFDYSVNDCLAIRTAFLKVGFVSCSFPGPKEQCNGFDDDCDGVVDNMPGSLSSDLGEDCYDGGDGTKGVGLCQEGTRFCVPATPANPCLSPPAPGDTACWSATCTDQVVPVAEVCNFEDDDCDYQTDEGVKVEYAWDGDQDGEPGSAPHIHDCPATPLDVRWIDFLPQMLTDCDDTDPSINHAASEDCSNLFVDENCNGTAEEGCPCNPLVDSPRICGPVPGGCEGQDWGASGCDAIGHPEHCAAGQQQCLYSHDQQQWQWNDSCWGALWGDPEICDGRDNDCDGGTDEDIEGLSQTCGYLDSGHEECVATPGGDFVVQCVDAIPWDLCENGSVSKVLPKFVPPLTESDAEFDTEGCNNKMDVVVSVQVYISAGGDIRADVYMYGYEPTSNYSKVEGFADYLVETAPAGCTIESLNVPNGGYAEYSDELCGSDEALLIPGNGVVSQWQIWGDHGGDEGGTWTGVSVHLNSISYEYCCTEG